MTEQGQPLFQMSVNTVSACSDNSTCSTYATVCVRSHVSSYASHQCRRPRKLEEDIGFPETGITDSCEMPRGHWELNPILSKSSAL